MAAILIPLRLIPPNIYPLNNFCIVAGVGSTLVLLISEQGANALAALHTVIYPIGVAPFALFGPQD